MTTDWTWVASLILFLGSSACSSADDTGAFVPDAISEAYGGCSATVTTGDKSSADYNQIVLAYDEHGDLVQENEWRPRGSCTTGPTRTGGSCVADLSAGRGPSCTPCIDRAASHERGAVGLAGARDVPTRSS